MQYPIKSTLTWTVSEDTDRLIMYTYVDGIMTNEIELLPQNGSMEVSPKKDTTYELVSFCGNILKDRKSLTIKVLIMPTTTPAPTPTPTTPTPIQTFKVRLYTNIPVDTTVEEQGNNFKSYVFNQNSNGSEKNITYNQGSNVSFNATPVIEIPPSLRASMGANTNDRWQAIGWFNKTTGEQLSSNAITNISITRNIDLEIRYELVIVTTPTPSPQPPTPPPPPPPVIDDEFIYIEAYTNMMPQLFDDAGQIVNYRLYNLGHLKLRVDDPLSNWEFYDNRGLTNAYFYTPNPYSNQPAMAVWATAWGTGVKIKKSEFSPISITLSDAYVGESLATDSNGVERKQFTASRQTDHLFNPSLMSSQGIIFDEGLHKSIETVDSLERMYLNPPKQNWAWYDASGNFYGNLGDSKTITGSIKLYLRARGVKTHKVTLSINRDPETKTISNSIYSLISHFSGNNKTYNVTVDPNAYVQSPHLNDVLLTTISPINMSLPFIYEGYKPYRASLHNLSAAGGVFLDGFWRNSTINNSFVTPDLPKTWYTGTELYVLDGESVSFNSFEGDNVLMNDFDLVDVWNNNEQSLANPAHKTFNIGKNLPSLGKKVVERDYNLFLKRKTSNSQFSFIVEVYDSSGQLKHSIQGADPTTQMSVEPISPEDKIIVKHSVPFEPYKNFILYKVRWGYAKNETFSMNNGQWNSTKNIIPIQNTSFPTLLQTSFNSLDQSDFLTDTTSVNSIIGQTYLEDMVYPNTTILTHFWVGTLLKRKYYYKGLYNFINNWGTSNLSAVDEDVTLVHNNFSDNIVSTFVEGNDSWQYQFDQTHVVSIVLAMAEYADDNNPVARMIQKVVNIPIRHISDFQQLNETPFPTPTPSTTPSPTPTPNANQIEYFVKPSNNATSVQLIKNLPSTPIGTPSKIKVFDVWYRDSQGNENLATNIPSVVTLGNPIISNKPPGLSLSLTRENSSIYLTYTGTPSASGTFETNLFMEDRMIYSYPFKGGSRTCTFNISGDVTDPIDPVVVDPTNPPNVQNNFSIVAENISDSLMRFPVGKQINPSQFSIFRVKTPNGASDSILPNGGTLKVSYVTNNLGSVINFPFSGYLGVNGNTVGTQTTGYISFTGVPSSAGILSLTYKAEYNGVVTSNTFNITFFNQTTSGGGGADTGGGGNPQSPDASFPTGNPELEVELPT